VDEGKPLPAAAARAGHEDEEGEADDDADGQAGDQGLTLADFKAQLEDLWKHLALVRAQLEHLRDTSSSG